jgi:hypothetical protein
MIRAVVVGWLLAAVVAGKELLMLQETFRHGARYPTYLETAAAFGFALTPDIRKELTSQGRSMHYLLGKLLYEKYWGDLFAGATRLNSSELFVKSTDVNRTIESAQSHLLGLLEKLEPLKLNSSDYKSAMPAWNGFPLSQPNLTDQWNVFSATPTFHSIPIHSQKNQASQCDGGDFLNKFEEANCPNQIYWIAENFNSDATLEIMRNQKVKAAIKALSDEVGTTVEFQDVFKWKDTDNCMQFLGRPTLKVFGSSEHGPILGTLRTTQTSSRRTQCTW